MYMLIGGDLVRVALFFMLVRLVSACHSRVIRVSKNATSEDFPLFSFV